MTLPNEHKLKELLQQWPDGTVATSLWLERLGISKQLRFSYKRSGWIEQLKPGAFKRFKETVSWQGGVFPLQTQMSSTVHPGALTALSMHGLLHYLRFEREKIYLFVRARERLPKWFESNEWEQDIKIYRTNFLPSNIGLVESEQKTFSIKISSPERAMLECLYFAPSGIDLIECHQIMEGLVNLRPGLLQTLLEGCTSIKVIRLFLYMAEKAGLQWLKYIDKSKLNMGRGARSIVKDGIYIQKYKITVPKELGEL